MRAFKFRSTENLHLLLDILIHSRLYCAPVNALNDVREGDVRVGNDDGRVNEVHAFGRDVERELQTLRLCSLSQIVQNHLLWAHYAAGYTGIAAEVEIPDEHLSPVEYSDNFIFLSAFQGKTSPGSCANSVLLKKYPDWKYENELRIISGEPFYSLPTPVRRILLGSRVSMALIASMHFLCSHYGVQLERIIIADWGIYTFGVQEVPLLKRRAEERTPTFPSNKLAYLCPHPSTLNPL